MQSSNRSTFKVTTAALTLAVQIAVAAQPAAAPHPHKQYPIDQFMATVSVRDASFSADETRILFSSNKTGVFNVYAVPVKGAEPTQLTHSTTDSTYAASYFPQDDRVLFTKDNGGNELAHLYVLSPAGKERDITPGKSLTADFIGWSKDGARFFVTTNERDPKYFDVYRYDAKTLARSLFYKNTDGLFPEQVSGDGQWIALSKPNTTNDWICTSGARIRAASRVSRRTRRQRSILPAPSMPTRNPSTSSPTMAVSSPDCAAICWPTVSSRGGEGELGHYLPCLSRMTAGIRRRASMKMRSRRASTLKTPLWVARR